MLESMDEIITQLRAAADPHLAAPLWGRAHKTLLKSAVDKGHLSQVIMRRDVDELASLVTFLRNGGKGKPEPAESTDNKIPEIDASTLRAAMRAFRKRLKLTRLDDESRINVNPLTAGSKSKITAIQPPYEFPPEVWQALVQAGELKDAGRGFLELVDE